MKLVILYKIEILDTAWAKARETKSATDWLLLRNKCTFPIFP